MSGVEAIGLALGCSTLAFGLVPSILDYRSLPEHCSELQDFITRQSTSLAIIEADFKALMDRELLSPGTLAMSEKEVESLRNLLHRYRKCLEDFRKMLTTMAKPKPTFFDLRRLQMILTGKTGPGLGTLQSRQSFLQMYMIELEATGYRKMLESNRAMHSAFGSRLSRAQLGRTASAAYRVSPLKGDCYDLTDDTTSTPNIEIIRPSSPTDTLVGTVTPEDHDYLCIPMRDDVEGFVTLQNSIMK